MRGRPESFKFVMKLVCKHNNRKFAEREKRRDWGSGCTQHQGIHTFPSVLHSHPTGNNIAVSYPASASYRKNCIDIWNRSRPMHIDLKTWPASRMLCVNFFQFSFVLLETECMPSFSALKWRCTLGQRSGRSAHKLVSELTILSWSMRSHIHIECF
jgi:hypothetical protein